MPWRGGEVGAGGLGSKHDQGGLGTARTQGVRERSHRVVAKAYQNGLFTFHRHGSLSLQLPPAPSQLKLAQRLSL